MVLVLVVGIKYDHSATMSFCLLLLTVESLLFESSSSVFSMVPNQTSLLEEIDVPCFVRHFIRDE